MVVRVVVADEHPAHVVGFDEGEQILEVLLAVRRAAGVDDHRFGSPDHHRVHVDRLRGDSFSDGRLDHERVRRDLDRTMPDRRGLCAGDVHDPTIGDDPFGNLQASDDPLGRRQRRRSTVLATPPPTSIATVNSVTRAPHTNGAPRSIVLLHPRRPKAAPAPAVSLR